MKKLALFIAALFMGASLFAQECGDCEEENLAYLNGFTAQNVAFGHLYTFTIPDTSNCSYWKEEYLIDWGDKGTDWNTGDVTEKYIELIFYGCPTSTSSPSISYRYVDWDMPPNCISEGPETILNPAIASGSGAAGETEPVTWIYYEYTTDEVIGAESYQWYILSTPTGAGFDFQNGIDDEPTVHIRFHDSEVLYKIRVRPTCSCDYATYPPYLGVTTQ